MKFIQNLLPENDINVIKNTLFNRSFHWQYQHPDARNVSDGRYLYDYENITDVENELNTATEMYGVSEEEKQKYLNFISYKPIYFEHPLFNDNISLSENSKFLSKILKTLHDTHDIGDIRLVRANCELFVKDETDTPDNYDTPSVESTNSLEENIYTLIYYVNTVDGDTVLFNEIYNHDTPNPELTIMHRQTPQEGSVLLFEGDRFNAEIPSKLENKALIRIIFESDEAISW
jgi:hypothetical protein